MKRNTTKIVIDCRGSKFEKILLRYEGQHGFLIFKDEYGEWIGTPIRFYESYEENAYYLDSFEKIGTDSLFLASMVREIFNRTPEIKRKEI